MKEVDVAQEIHDEGVGRLEEDVVGRPLLLDAAAVHDDDAVGYFEGLFLIVRDKDAGDVNLVVQLAEPSPQFLGGPSRPEPRTARPTTAPSARWPAPGQRHPLPLPAGQLRRIAGFEAFELHELQQAADLLADLLPRRPQPPRPHAQPEGHVLHHRHVAEKRVVLKDEADAALADAGLGDAAVVEADFAAAGVGRFQAGNDPQQRRLPGTGRPEQGDEFARGDLQAHLGQGRVAAETLRDAAGLDAHWPSPSNRAVDR